MKVVFFAFLLLMLVGNVMAMDDPIRVKARVDEEVRVFLWPAEYGPAINSDKGMTDSDGYFTTKIFFSLDSDNFTVQIAVFDSDGYKMGSGDFRGMNSLSPIFIDCGSRDCKLSSWVVEEEVENETVVVDNESVVVDNETVDADESIEENETVVVVENETVVEDEDEEMVSFTGNAIFKDEDGSFNWSYSISGGFILMFMFVFVFIMFHRAKKGGILNGDDKELKYMEKKMKVTEDKIKSLKDDDVKKRKLQESRSRLVADEKELAALESERSQVNVEMVDVREEVRKQEDVVDMDEKKLDSVEDQVDAQRRPDSDNQQN